MNYVCLFDVLRVDGVSLCCSGHRVMREINASPVSIYERKAIDHRAIVTQSRDDGTQRILFR